MKKIFFFFLEISCNVWNIYINIFPYIKNFYFQLYWGNYQDFLIDWVWEREGEGSIKDDSGLFLGKWVDDGTIHW